MSYDYSFNQSGNYLYHNIVNPSMTGTIVVSSTSNTSIEVEDTVISMIIK